MSLPVLTTTANDLVRGALRLIGEIDANQSVDAAQTQDSLESLNFMVKSFQTQGLHLWTKVEAILFLDIGRTNYFLGPSGDEAANEDDFIKTQLTVAAVATDTTLTVASTTGLVIGDFVGIRLDTNIRHWTKILLIPSSTTVTITDAMPSAAAISNSVFTFTSLIPRPLRLLQVRRDTIDSLDEEIESDLWSRQEYFAQPNKASQGDLVQWYYTPELVNGRIYVWQTSNNVDKVARFTYERPIDINVTTGDNPDFPAEWFEMLKYNLAVRIATEYRTPADRINRIDLLAREMLENALGFDTEYDSMDLQPDFVRN